MARAAITQGRMVGSLLKDWHVDHGVDPDRLAEFAHVVVSVGKPREMVAE